MSRSTSRTEPQYSNSRLQVGKVMQKVQIQKADAALQKVQMQEADAESPMRLGPKLYRKRPAEFLLHLLDITGPGETAQVLYQQHKL